MELAAIVAGLLITVGGLVVLAGIGRHAWMAGHRDRLRVPIDRAGALARRDAPHRQAREARSARRARSPRTGRAAGNAVVPALRVAAVSLTVIRLGALVDNVIDGDGIAVLDHPVARFVVAHRTPLLTQ